MKKLKFLPLLLALAGMVAVSSCKKDESPGYPELIIGTWKSDKPFYSDKPDSYNYKRYTSVVATINDDIVNATYKDGKDWTIGDTNENSEGVEFYYKIEGNVLREQLPMIGVGYLPRTYTIKTLTANKLEYVDPFGDVSSFTKQ